jgi:hypothetical protein
MTDLGDGAQLGIPTEKGEPVYVLRASNFFAPMVLRFIASASADLGLMPTERTKIRKIALAMDEWRKKNRGKTP